jgi:hypothetical protein
MVGGLGGADFFIGMDIEVHKHVGIFRIVVHAAKIQLLRHSHLEEIRLQRLVPGLVGGHLFKEAVGLDPP